MRVGINTGEVVVQSIRKDDLHTDYVPVGYSTNLAARREQMVTPGSMKVTKCYLKCIIGSTKALIRKTLRMQKRFWRNSQSVSGLQSREHT